MQEENIGCYKKSMSCRKVVMRHLPIIVSDGTVNGREESGRYPNPAGRQTFGYDKHFYMNGNGFTLIELLVVVLIIGILAAVAVPQYQKAVEKSRAATVLPLLKAVGQAQESYKMANGEYATSFDELSVDVPWTGNTKWYINENAEKDTRSNADWSIALKQASAAGVTMGRISGSYAGVGFVYILQDSVLPTGTILCTEQISGGINYGGSKGSYCQKIMRAGEEVDGGSARYLWYL